MCCPTCKVRLRVRWTPCFPKTGCSTVAVKGPRLVPGALLYLYIFLQIARKQKWRDPDSNQGHHDFEVCSRTLCSVSSRPRIRSKLVHSAYFKQFEIREVLSRVTCVAATTAATVTTRSWFLQSMFRVCLTLRCRPRECASRCRPGPSPRNSNRVPHGILPFCSLLEQAAGN